MRIIQGLLFLFFGLGLLWADWRAWGTGWLPFGANGFKGRLELTRSERPLAFWLAFAAYAVAGIWLAVFALRLLAGATAPLALR